MKLKHQAEGKSISLVAEYEGNIAGYINIYPDSEWGSFAKLPPYSQEEKVSKLAEENKTLTSADVRDLLGISSGSTNVLLSGMVKTGILVEKSRGICEEVNK